MIEKIPGSLSPARSAPMGALALLFVACGRNELPMDRFRASPSRSGLKQTSGLRRTKSKSS